MSDELYTLPKASSLTNTALSIIADGSGKIGKTPKDAKGIIRLPKNVNYSEINIAARGNSKGASDSGLSSASSFMPSSAVSATSAASSIGNDPADGAVKLLNPAAYEISDIGGGFDTIVGMEHVKLEITSRFIMPLKVPQLFNQFGGGLPSILMYGPPGNGKTFITRAIAGEMNQQLSRTGKGIRLFQALGSNMGSKYQNETERNIRGLWTMVNLEAEKDAIVDPSAAGIIFMDEIEALAARRGAGGDSHDDGSTVTLLQVMEGVESFERVRVIASTNLPWKIDSAILSRFKVKIFVDLPTYDARHDRIINIMSKICKKECIEDDAIQQIIEMIADMTGPNGSELRDWHENRGHYGLNGINNNAVSVHGFSMRDIDNLFSRINSALVMLKVIELSIDNANQNKCVYITGTKDSFNSMLTLYGINADTRETEKLTTKNRICETPEFQNIRLNKDFVKQNLEQISLRALQDIKGSTNDKEYKDLVQYYKTGHDPL